MYLLPHSNVDLFVDEMVTNDRRILSLGFLSVQKKSKKWPLNLQTLIALKALVKKIIRLAGNGLISS